MEDFTIAPNLSTNFLFNFGSEYMWVDFEFSDFYSESFTNHLAVTAARAFLSDRQTLVFNSSAVNFSNYLSTLGVAISTDRNVETPFNLTIVQLISGFVFLERTFGFLHQISLSAGYHFYPLDVTPEAYSYFPILTSVEYMELYLNDGQVFSNPEDATIRVKLFGFYERAEIPPTPTPTPSVTPTQTSTQTPTPTPTPTVTPSQTLILDNLVKPSSIKLNGFWNPNPNIDLGEKNIELNWNPVDFDVIGDQFNLKKTQLTFSNGIKFNFYPFFEDITDFSFNNKSGIFLTNLKNNNEILEEKNEPRIAQELKKIKTIAFDQNQRPLKHYSILNGLSGLESRDEIFTIEDELTFHFEDSYVYVEDVYGRILTNAGFGESQLPFDLKRSPLLESQKWDYIMGDDIISLFSYNTNYSGILRVIQSFPSRPPRLQLQPFNADKDTLVPSDSFLYLRSYKNRNRTYESVSESYTVKYDSSPLLNKRDIVKIKDNDNYKQNYLAIFPYEFEKENKKYDFYFHGLKNYQNSNYEYSLPENNRIYYKINTGTNQNKGLYNVYLTYQTKTISIIFETGKRTKFYLSPTSDQINIKDADFIERGAFSGRTPKTADKLFANRDIDLYEIREIAEIIKPPFDKDNKYLCSWLYENDNGEKAWYDRYYNPAYYSLDAALSSTHLLYNAISAERESFIFDIESEIKLKTGVPYEYYRIGKQDCLNALNDFNYSFSDVDGIKYSNVLNITSWSSGNLIDFTPYNNYGITVGSDSNFYGDYWELDGTNHAVFQATDSILPQENLTLSLWLKFDDWNKINAYQIFGNFYESGFGLINESQSLANLITIVNQADQTLYNFNVFFSESSRAKISLRSPRFIIRLPDLSYYVIDDEDLIICKYDINNSLVFKKTVLGVFSIDQVELDSNFLVYIYDNRLKLVSVYDPAIDDFYQISVSQNATRIEIDLNDQLLGVGVSNNTTSIVGDCSVVDNNNSIWQIIGSNLYKDFSLVGTVGYSNQMSCDRYNNIWILSNDDSYTKYNQETREFEFRYYFNQIPLIGETSCPPSPAVPKETFIPFKDEDLPFLATSSLLYILTIPDYDLILVRPKPPDPEPIVPFEKTKRVLNFISLPLLKDDIDKSKESLCGDTLNVLDRAVIVDWNLNQAFILNQEGQLVSKLNLEDLVEGDNGAIFKTDGDFTGYQYFRKYKNTNNTQLSWKYELIDTSFLALNKFTQRSETLKYDVSNLSNDWHHFCFVFDKNKAKASYYIDSVLVDSKSIPVADFIFYKNRTSLILGATTIKNTLLNDFLNIPTGYKMIGYVSDLKLYNIALEHNDIKQLYYSSVFSPDIYDLNWEMNVGFRNYVEEISKWFSYQLPTNKSKYFNINIHNLNVNNNVKDIIENSLKNIIVDMSPAHTVLNKINWKE